MVDMLLSTHVTYLIQQDMMASAAEWERERIIRCSVPKCSSPVVNTILHSLCVKPSQWLEPSTQILAILENVKECIDNYEVLACFVSLITSCLVCQVNLCYN